MHNTVFIETAEKTIIIKPQYTKFDWEQLDYLPFLFMLSRLKSNSHASECSYFK